MTQAIVSWNLASKNQWTKTPAISQVTIQFIVQTEIHQIKGDTVIFYCVIICISQKHPWESGTYGLPRQKALANLEGQ